MYRLRRSWLCRLAILPIAVTWSACDKSAPAVADQPSPEEGFKFIVSTIRRAIETTSSGVMPSGSLSGGGGFTALSIRTQVADEYIAPATDGDAPRGRITIASESEIMIQPGARNGEDGNERKSNELGGPSAEGATDIESLIQAARSQSGRGNGPPLSESSLPRTSKASKTYELVHKDGRWTLETDIDREKEPAAFEALDYALKTQL
jgi:hypothetical protein